MAGGTNKPTEGADFVEMVKTLKRRRGGTGCSVCSRPKVRDAVNAMVQARADGETDASYQQMCELIKEHLGERLLSNTLRNHVARCTPDLYRRLAESE